MSKRILSRRQKWRINKIQEERAARLSQKGQQKDQQLDDLISKQALGPEQKGLILAHYGTQLAVEALEGENKGDTLRCHFRANLEALVAGDEVVWRRSSDGSGVIVAQMPRRSELCRPDANGNVRPVAANINHIIIVIAPKPAPSSKLIDRYLVAAELHDIEPILLLNKEDLIADDTLSGEPEGAPTSNAKASSSKSEIEDLLDVYKSIGYQVIRSSSHTEHGMDQLKQLLGTGCYIFAGQSGVGKSSLVNSLLPDISQKVSALSPTTGQGMHTTTTAFLFHIPTGGMLIDSPGIREFGLWQVDTRLIAEGFIDFRPYLGHCKFRDCSHQAEPGCALRTAVTDGHLNQQRLDNYFAIIASITNPDNN